MINLFLIITCLLGLIWSANHLVAGAAGLAHFYRISSLLIGLTIIAFGLSIPIIYVAILEALAHRTNLVISNAIGANIANIGLVLGLTILLRPPKIPSSLFRHGYPLLFLIMLFTYSMMLSEYFSVADGCFLLLAAIALICYFAYLTKHSIHECDHIQSFRKAAHAKRDMKLNRISLMIGFVMIPIFAHYLTTNLIRVAQWAQISDVIIQLTLLSISTSIPVLITCIIATLKGQSQLAVGIILGSNMFNLLAVLAFPGIIDPSVVPSHIVFRDMPMMLALTFLIFLINYNTKHRMIRWHGGLLILIYGCYVFTLIYQ